MNPNTTVRHAILLTKESGNNHYWDTTFCLRPPFRGNSNGQYKITVNEAHFNNTEPFMKKGDYFQFTIKAADGKIFKWKVMMKKDFYLYRQGTQEWTQVIKLIVGSLGGASGQPLYQSTPYQQCIRERYAADGTTLEHTYDETDNSFSMLIKLVNDDGTDFNGTNRGVNPLMFYDVYNIQLKEVGAGGTIIDHGAATSIELTYSWGFVYLLNNRADVCYPVTDDAKKPTTDAGHFYFEFCNLRLGGPYLYILDMPTVKTDVMTMNEINQCYNLTGVVKNVADNHNENVQFISSMQGRVNSFTNFRIRLLDDNFEPVRIRSPLYIQITISNDDE